MDGKCSHNHYGYWFGCVIVSMGDCSARVDCRSLRHVVVRLHRSLHLMLACRLLSLRWSSYWQEKPYLHACRSLPPWYEIFLFFFSNQCFLKSYIFIDILISLKLGEAHMVACGVMQNINLMGITIGYQIASSISMM